MPRKSVYRAVADIDRQALAEFQAGIRKRYTDEQILAELKQSAERLGRSPTMREFSADPKTTDWTRARKTDDSLLTEWQIYRMFDARRGAWSTFQFLVRERLREAGVEVAPDGTIS